MSFEKPITIARAISAIADSNYVLPAIQREFVWDAEQIEKLFDSLLLGYPIGAFLFWEVKPEKLDEFQFYRFMDDYHERDQKHNPPANLKGRQVGITAVLDGQQRLTALNIGLRGTYADKLPYYRWDSDDAFPKRRLYLNLLAPPDADDLEFAYEFRMLREKDLDYNNGGWTVSCVGMRSGGSRCANGQSRRERFRKRVDAIRREEAEFANAYQRSLAAQSVGKSFQPSAKASPTIEPITDERWNPRPGQLGNPASPSAARGVRGTSKEQVRQPRGLGQGARRREDRASIRSAGPGSQGHRLRLRRRPRGEGIDA